MMMRVRSFTTLLTYDVVVYISGMLPMRFPVFVKEPNFSKQTVIQGTTHTTKHVHIL